MATLLKTLFAAIALLAVLVAIKFECEHHLAPTTSGIHGAMVQPRLDVLLVGSSHTRQGYDVRALEEQTGKSAFLVAYDGLDLRNMLPLLRLLLADPGKRPALLVIEANASTLARAPGIEDPRFFFDAPPGLKRAVIRDYMRTHQGKNCYLDMWSLIANRGSETILTWPLVHRLVDSFSYRGGYMSKDMTGIPPALFPSERVPVEGDIANPDQVAALREIVKLAAADHVKLIAADPPMPGPAEAQPEMMSLKKSWRGLAAADEIPYFQGADGFPTDDPALFHDSNHLSTAGRALYTQRFGEYLRSKLQAAN